MVCHSNNNRSMEGHRVLKEAGFKVESYGTGRTVKMPGPSQDKPNVFEFGFPYAEMLAKLKAENEELYKANGMIEILTRNASIKRHPEKFQHAPGPFDIVVTLEERIFDNVCEDLAQREPKWNSVVHVFGLEVKDTPAESLIAGKDILDLCTAVDAVDGDLEDVVDDLVEEFEAKHPNRPVLHAMHFQ